MLASKYTDVILCLVSDKSGCEAIGSDTACRRCESSDGDHRIVGYKQKVLCSQSDDIFCDGKSWVASKISGTERK